MDGSVVSFLRGSPTTSAQYVNYRRGFEARGSHLICFIHDNYIGMTEIET